MSTNERDTTSQETETAEDSVKSSDYNDYKFGTAEGRDNAANRIKLAYIQQNIRNMVVTYNQKINNVDTELKSIEHSILRLFNKGFVKLLFSKSSRRKLSEYYDQRERLYRDRLKYAAVLEEFDSRFPDLVREALPISWPSPV